MNKLSIPAVALIAAVFSANAFAHRDWDDEDERCEPHFRYRAAPVVVDRAYAPPVAVYEAPPVVYRERIVVQEAPPVYYRPAPRYYEPPPAYSSYNGNRVAGQAIGAIAGGIIGNQVGGGNGRVAATAVGAVIGSMVGGRMAGYDY